jgi:hypothetical protein
MLHNCCYLLFDELFHCRTLLYYARRTDKGVHGSVRWKDVYIMTKREVCAGLIVEKSACIINIIERRSCRARSMSNGGICRLGRLIKVYFMFIIIISMYVKWNFISIPARSLRYLGPFTFFYIYKSRILTNLPLATNWTPGSKPTLLWQAASRRHCELGHRWHPTKSRHNELVLVTGDRDTHGISSSRTTTNAAQLNHLADRPSRFCLACEITYLINFTYVFTEIFGLYLWLWFDTKHRWSGYGNLSWSFLGCFQGFGGKIELH